MPTGRHAADVELVLRVEVTGLRKLQQLGAIVGDAVTESLTKPYAGYQLRADDIERDAYVVHVPCDEIVWSGDDAALPDVLAVVLKHAPTCTPPTEPCPTHDDGAPVAGCPTCGTANT